MRRLLLFCAIVSLASGAACTRNAGQAGDREAVRQVLDRYVASIEKEDFHLYAELVANDPVMVNFGAFGDPIIGWDGLKEVMANQNQALERTTITVRDVRIHVTSSGKVAWATSIWDFRSTSGGREMNLPIRCSWILEKRDGVWVIVHFHKSVAA